MRKKKSQGPKRMKELGKKKVEVWFTEAQAVALAKLAAALGTRPASLVRRCANYVVAGGINAAHPVRGGRYD